MVSVEQPVYLAIGLMRTVLGVYDKKGEVFVCASLRMCVVFNELEIIV